MSSWLKSIGTGVHPIAEDWYHARDGWDWFSCPKNAEPSFEVGDGVLLYASGHRKIIAAVEVTEEPEWNPDFVKDRGVDGNRWPWLVIVRPTLIVPFVSDAPSLESADVRPLSVRSKSHIRLTPAQYRAGVAALAQTAALNGERYAALMD